MAWTARITDKTFDNAVLHISVELKQGKQIVNTVYQLTNAQSADWLKERIAEKVAVLEALDAYEQSLSKGAFDFTLTPKTPDTPTVAELEKRAFEQAVRALRRAEKGLETGVKTDQDVDALRDEVKRLYKEDFADLL